MGLRRALLAFLVAVLLLLPPEGPGSVSAQGGGPPGAVTAIYQKKTPEELVGQLFLVTFTGTDTSNKSQI